MNNHRQVDFERFASRPPTSHLDSESKLLCVNVSHNQVHNHYGLKLQIYTAHYSFKIVVGFGKYHTAAISNTNMARDFHI